MNEEKDDQNIKIHSSPRWFTPEFIFYYIILFIGYTYQIQVALIESDKYNNGEQTVEGLQPGWIPGRKIDLSDTQWSLFRQWIPLMFAILVVFSSLSNLTAKAGGPLGRLLFYNVTSVLIMFFLHGSGAFWVYAIALINYMITKIFGRSRLLTPTIWGFNLVILWSTYFWHKYKFATFFGREAEWIDNIGGLLNWEIYFKTTMLRLISFAMDYHWTATNRMVPPLKGRTPYFIAQEKHLPLEQYGLLQYFAFLFYPPLYIAGPICTFNAWTSQVYTGPQANSHEPNTLTLPSLIKALAKITLVLIGFEVVLHYIYYYAFNEHGVWREFRNVEVCITGYFVLNFMYHKFLIIWRIFRLAGEFDGIETPDNMNRCVSNNYTFTGFWRSWHASFNLWTVRYLYIPLGGRKTQTATIWLIFLFIGLWHDLWISWVAWAMLNCVFFSLEIMIMVYFSRPSMRWLTGRWYYRHIVGAAGAANIFLLMAANLAILHGFEDSVRFVRRAFWEGPSGGQTLFLAWFWLFCGVIVMQEIRAAETRGKNVKRF